MLPELTKDILTNDFLSTFKLYNTTMKIALVCDDLIQYGGQEKLILYLHEVFPEAPLYAAVASHKWRELCKKEKVNLKSSFMQHLPFVEKLNRFYSVFFTHVLAFQSFDFSEYDIVLSVSSRYAHMIITKPKTKHIAYVNSPGRMFWEMTGYFEKERISRFKNLADLLLSFPLSFIKAIDYVSAQRIDILVANSHIPAKRIEKYYKRECRIIYPFVDTEVFEMPGVKNGDYYLVITRLVPWKRVDIAITACKNLGLKLKIVGEGPDLARLKHISNQNIEFLGFVSEKEKAKLLSECVALIQTQYEDFGIVPLEAMASGKSVIAFGKGGVTETVLPGITGEFYFDQSTEALMKVLKTFNPAKYSPLECKIRARKFNKNAFKQNILGVVLTA